MKSHAKTFLLYWICDNKKKQKKYSVNPLHLFFSKVNGYFKEINGNKYLTLGATSRP